MTVSRSYAYYRHAVDTYGSERFAVVDYDKLLQNPSEQMKMVKLHRFIRPRSLSLFSIPSFLPHCHFYLSNAFLPAFQFCLFLKGHGIPWCRLQSRFFEMGPARLQSPPALEDRNGAD